MKELLLKREESVKQFNGPIYLEVMKSNTQLAVDKIKLDAEIALLKDQITAIEKLI